MTKVKLKDATKELLKGAEDMLGSVSTMRKSADDLAQAARKLENQFLREEEQRRAEEKQAEQDAKIASERRSQVGTGDRSERIRTYNYPQSRVTDHRIGLTMHSLEAFLDGDLDEMLDALAPADTAAKLAKSIEG